MRVYATEGAFAQERRRSSESGASSEPPRSWPPTAAAATQRDPETGAPEAAVSGAETAAVASSTDLVEEQQRVLVDLEAESTDKAMQDLELTTVELFPESRLVICLALICLLWILFLIISAAVIHGAKPTETTTAATEAPHQTPIPDGKTTTTEEPLLDVFVCSTEYCKREGEHIKSLTSQSSKKPCENFYEHVCEAWRKSASSLQSNQPGSAVSTDTMLQNGMEADLLAYITDAKNNDMAPARALYESCKSRREEDRALPWAKQLFRSWGSEWPRTDSRGTINEVWRFAAKLMRNLGVQSLVGVEVGLDWLDISRTTIEVGPPETIFFAKDKYEQRVMALFTEATRSAARAMNPQDAHAPDAAAHDVKFALESLADLNLDDLGTSPLDFEADTLGSLGKGVQAFVHAVFENVAVLDGRTRILIHRGPLVRRELDEKVNRIGAKPMLNYLGLLALVALSPFLSDGLAQLRVLHSVHTLGRAEAPTTEQICLRAASQAYPACVAMASERVNRDVRRSVWLSQLETLFVGLVGNVTWVDNLTSLLVRYKMRHYRLARFFPAWPTGSCSELASYNAIPVDAFVQAVSLRQTQQIQSVRCAPLQASTGSPLAVWARFRLCLQLVQIPPGLINGSVPSNGTFFALHLSRFAVRLYAALAQLLYEGTVYESEIPLYFTDEAEGALLRAIDCLLCDARGRFPRTLDVYRVQHALLEQVLALQLGFFAYRRLMGVRRIWHHDFQLSTLPGTTADQLFFLYYALDHCELSDAVFQSHEFEAHRRLPASVRVNAAVRQFPRFAHAFRCARGSPMAAPEPCDLLRQ
ncbi:neprilysin-1-like [Haemaphysalis longicornis]